MLDKTIEQWNAVILYRKQLKCLGHLQVLKLAAHSCKLHQTYKLNLSLTKHKKNIAQLSLSIMIYVAVW